MNHFNLDNTEPRFAPPEPQFTPPPYVPGNPYMQFPSPEPIRNPESNKHKVIIFVVAAIILTAMVGLGVNLLSDRVSSVRKETKEENLEKLFRDDPTYCEFYNDYSEGEFFLMLYSPEGGDLSVSDATLVIDVARREC